MNALWSLRRDISLHMISPHATTLNVLEHSFLEYEGMPVLEWPGYSPDMNPIENILNIMEKEIGNQKPCKRIYVEASM